MSFQKVVNARANVQAMNIIHGIQRIIGSALTGNGKTLKGNVVLDAVEDSAKCYSGVTHD